MTAIHDRFVCELMVSLAIAATVWIIGFFLFIIEDKTPDTYKTSDLPRKSANEINKFEIGFLQDLIKWAEMLIEEIDSARSTLERKALLMASFSLAVMAYLFSDVSRFNNASEEWTAIVYMLFGTTTVLCIKAINFSGYYPRGQLPHNFYQKTLSGIPTGKEQKVTMYCMLQEYIQCIRSNWGINNEKYSYIRIAKYFLIFGVGGLVSMALESSEWICHVCCWLANYVTSQLNIFEICPIYP